MISTFRSPFPPHTPFPTEISSIFCEVVLRYPLPPIPPSVSISGGGGIERRHRGVGISIPRNFPLLTFYETFLGRVLGAHQWAGEGGSEVSKVSNSSETRKREGGADRPRFWTRIHQRGCGSKVDPPAINTNQSNASPPRVDPFPSPLQLLRRRRRPIKLG